MAAQRTYLAIDLKRLLAFYCHRCIFAIYGFCR